MSDTQPEISVVIPTRNRAALLGKGLTGLCQQTLDPARYEICVVNNGSTDATAQVVALFKTYFPQHRLFIVDEPAPGVAHARNAGVRHTTAPLIVQGDDDAMAPPDWLARFLDAFARLGGRVGKIGGDVIPIWGAPRPDWISDNMLPLLTAASGFGTGARFVQEGLLECNGCYRRQALVEAGLFPVTLGRKGSSLMSAEHAVDLVMNVAGWGLYYEPSIVIEHFIHPERLTPLWFRRRYFWQGVSDYAVYDYLNGKGVVIAQPAGVELPLDRSCWTFINDANEPPTEANLNRLRGLGFALAKSEFMPTSV